MIILPVMQLCLIQLEIGQLVCCISIPGKGYHASWVSELAGPVPECDLAFFCDTAALPELVPYTYVAPHRQSALPPPSFR
jgi:hypothetical protein